MWLSECGASMNEVMKRNYHCPKEATIRSNWVYEITGLDSPLELGTGMWDWTMTRT